MSLSEKRKVLNVPFEVARYIVKYGLFAEGKLYLYLKYRSDGYVTIDRKLYSQICEDLNISLSTARRNINWLRAQGWLQREFKNVYRVISFTRLYFRVRVSKSKTGIFWDGPNFQETKAFLIAGCVKKIVQCQKVKKRVPSTGGTQTLIPKWAKEISHICSVKAIDFSKSYLSKSFFASLIGIPLTTAYDYLQYAVIKGLLVKSNNQIESILKPEEVRFGREANGNLFNKVVIRYKKTYVRLPNSYISFVCLRIKKELRYKDIFFE